MKVSKKTAPVAATTGNSSKKKSSTLKEVKISLKTLVEMIVEAVEESLETRASILSALKARGVDGVKVTWNHDLNKFVASGFLGGGSKRIVASDSDVIFALRGLLGKAVGVPQQRPLTTATPPAAPVPPTTNNSSRPSHASI